MDKPEYNFEQFKSKSNRKFYDKINFSEKIDFSQLINHQKNITFTNCNFQKEFIITNNSNINSIIFQNCSFNDKIIFNHSEFKNLNFYNCELAKFFTSNKLIVQNLIIEDCSISHNNDISFFDFKTNRLVFSNNELESNIFIKPKKINELILRGNSEKSYEIEFSFEEKNEVISRFFLFSESTYKTNYILRSFNVNHLQLVGSLNAGSILINNIQLKKAIIHRFSNYGDLKISMINPIDNNSIIILKQTYLGKAQFNNINFNNFEKILLNSSIIFEILTVNIIWCNKKIINSNTQLELKENYRQLKMVAAKNDDSITKFNFLEFEMDENLSILKKEKKIQDYLILLSNKYSNSYGNDWFKALTFIIIINIVIFTIIRYLQGYTIFNGEKILDEIGAYFSFINPIHKFEDVFSEKSTTYKNTLFWDSISRILNAYFIFQFISAFRKFNK